MIHSQPFNQNEWGMKKSYGNVKSCNQVKIIGREMVHKREIVSSLS